MFDTAVLNEWIHLQLQREYLETLIVCMYPHLAYSMTF